MTSKDLDITGKTWGERAQQLQHPETRIRSWADSPVVRELYINPLITGSPAVGWFQWVAEQYFWKKVERVLSIGSGDGALERHGMILDVAERFDGYDVSSEAVVLARELAARRDRAGRVQYHTVDLNRHFFPPSTYDAVFASQSLHHLEALEHFFDQVDRTLKPDGLFIVNEFVGANQFQWSDEQMKHANEELQKIPKRYRWSPVLQEYKTSVVRQTVEEMNRVDPTEAIRSEDLLPLINDRFDVIDRKDFGGTIVNLVLEGIAGNFSSGEEDKAVLRRLFQVEQDLLRRGELDSDFAILIACKKGRGKSMWARKQSDDDIRLTDLARQYQVVHPGLELEIHPDDEMYSYPINLQKRPPREALEEYFRVGRTTFSMIEQVLGWAGKSWTDLSSVLDFASGYGRNTRFLVTAVPADRISVSDILEPAVEFQKKLFGVRGFVSTTNPDDAEIDGQFDLISVVSLFSHLPERTFGPWLHRLVSVLAPGGTLVFTTHGPEVFRSEHEQEMDGEFVFQRTSEIPSLDVQDYGRSYCTRGYVERLLEGLPDAVLMSHVSRGLNGHQDVYVVGNASEMPGSALVLRDLPRVRIDLARYRPEGILEIAGWALDGEEFAPVPTVKLYLDGEYLGSAELGVRRPDLAVELGSDCSAGGGWQFHTRKELPGMNTRLVVALAEDQQGLKGVDVKPLR